VEDAGRLIADRYELVSALGHGGMGVVWRALDKKLGRAVAVKLLPAASIGNDLARARLIREARAAAALEHEGIIRVYDVGETDDGGAFLVMELVRGRSLRSALEQGALGPVRLAEIIVQAARALAFAHAEGIIHRDIKPDNIMIRDDGRAIVVDFGVAKPVPTELLPSAETVPGVTSASLTAAGQLIGTPAYFAPEQARSVEVGPGADQFALAVTAYEAFTGAIPWIGRGVVEVVAAILRDEPKPPSAVDPRLPVALDHVLLRALAKTPADRFPTSAAFADALEEAVSELPPEPSAEGAPAVSRAPSSSGAKAVARAPTTTGGAHVSTPNTSPRSLRTPLSIGAVLLAIVGGVWWVGSRAPAASRGAAASASARGATNDAIACPIFEVTGIDAPWLGAAAAALACERVQFARNGSDATTLSPAELAGAPREIVQGFPLLMDAPDARAKSLVAAKGVYRSLDGRVDREPMGYVVTIVLRGEGDASLARGEGRGIELFEAVSAAMQPVVRVLPASKEDVAARRESLDVESVDDALALLDVHTAILVEDLVSMKRACSAVAARASLFPRVQYLAKLQCARRLRTPPPAEPPPPVDASTLGALVTTTLAQGSAGGPVAVRERAKRLEDARETASAEGKARLSAAAAELYNLVGDERARELARAAVYASPKAFDWRSSGWHRLAFTSEGDGALGAALRAWTPWEPVTQSLRSRAGLVDAKARSVSVWRAYLLSQRGTYATQHGSELLQQGDVEAARGVAELAQDQVLRIEILRAEAKYGQVAAAVPKLVAALPADDENAALAFRLADSGVRAFNVLDRPADFMQSVVDRYVTSEPPHIVDGVAPFVSLVTACSMAPRSVGKPCLERIERLRTDGRLPNIFLGMEVVLRGGLRFVADDYTGAAKIWRTLLRYPGWVQDPLRDAMAIAFDRAGEPDLADEVDAPPVALLDMPHTADLAWVRSARRAQKRGDVVKARKLAEAVIEKWRFADEDIPAVREMKDLLAKLPPK
jgi:serine/threonine protein kinase